MPLSGFTTAKRTGNSMTRRSREKKQRRASQREPKPELTFLFIRNVSGWGGQAKLWNANKHIAVPGTMKFTRHVVSVEITQNDHPRTFLYAVDAIGRALDFAELHGSLDGELDHEKAIRAFEVDQR